LPTQVSRQVCLSIPIIYFFLYFSWTRLGNKMSRWTTRDDLWGARTKLSSGPTMIREQIIFISKSCLTQVQETYAKKLHSYYLCTNNYRLSTGVEKWENIQISP
jgi:hypothetical protein